MRNFFQSSSSFWSTSFVCLVEEADQEINEVDPQEGPCVIQEKRMGLRKIIGLRPFVHAMY